MDLSLLDLRDSEWGSKKHPRVRVRKLNLILTLVYVMWGLFATGHVCVLWASVFFMCIVVGERQRGETVGLAVRKPIPTAVCPQGAWCAGLCSL